MEFLLPALFSDQERKKELSYVFAIEERKTERNLGKQRNIISVENDFKNKSGIHQKITQIKNGNSNQKNPPQKQAPITMPVMGKSISKNKKAQTDIAARKKDVTKTKTKMAKNTEKWCAARIESMNDQVQD